MTKLLLLILLSFLSSCSHVYESVMPFRNLIYLDDRLLPIKTNDADFSIRIWVNFSTSVDRVISITRDTFERNDNNGYKGSLIELGSLNNKRTNKKYFRTIKIEPQSGFEAFKSKIDSLHFDTIQNQKDFGHSLHSPFTLYVIEIKEGEKFNTFRFNSHFPSNEKNGDQFDQIQDLIFKEFGQNLKFMMKGSK